MVKKFKEFLFSSDEGTNPYGTYDEEYGTSTAHSLSDEEEVSTNKQPVKLTAIEGRGGSSVANSVLIMEPRSFSESKDITDHLKQRKGVIINLQRLPKDQAKSVIDFLSGAIYALDGQIQKIGPQTFILAPHSLDLSGNITEYLSDFDQE
ncbi:MAG: cell division protein SepF [Bacilli bacterium]